MAQDQVFATILQMRPRNKKQKKRKIHHTQCRQAIHTAMTYEK